MKHTFRILLSGIFFICITGSSYAQDWTSTFRRQTEALEIDPGVLTEIQLFDEKDHSLSVEYAAALARQLRDIAFSQTASRLKTFQEGPCVDAVEVDFLKAGLKLKDFPIELGPAEKDFEKGFIRVEAVACFPDITQGAAEALELYTSPEFRMSTSSTVKRVDEDQGASCVETKGIPVILKATLYCNRVQNFFADGMAVQHSQVTSNPEPGKFQNVFFKESLKSFVELPGGGLGFYYINYSRSDRIGSLKRSLGKNSVITSQKKALEKLRQRLKEKTGPTTD